MKRTKLQRLLNKLDGRSERTRQAISDFDTSVKTLRDKLTKEISASTLEEVNSKINKLRKSIDLDPIIQGVTTLEDNFRESILSILGDIEAKDKELRDLNKQGNLNLSLRADELTNDLSKLNQDLDTLTNRSQTELNLINNELGRLLEASKSFATKEELAQATDKSAKATQTLSETKDKDVSLLKERVEEVRSELVNRINNKGGGGANRNILVGGNPSTLSKYGDVNIKAGNNVTITYSQNNTLKTTDITIASSGGGSSVAGTVRSISTTNVSSTVGAVAGTDYVVIAGAGVKIDLPTAVNNTNLYTIKNKAASSVLIVASGAETIDGDANIILATQFTAVDLISDSANWHIT